MIRKVVMLRSRNISAFLVACAFIAWSHQVHADRQEPCSGFSALVFDTNISSALKARMQNTTGPSVEVSPWTPKPVVREARESVYPLGQGQAGGKVSKVVPWDGGKAFVRKEYFTESSFANDVRALGYLREITGANSKVKVVSTLEVKPPKTLHLDFVEGKSLNAVLVDARSSETSKMPPRRAYAEFLNQVKKAISLRPEVTNIEVVHVPGLDGMPIGLRFQALVRDADGNMTSTNLFIKSDNILVEDKTGRLVLIDPF